MDAIYFVLFSVMWVPTLICGVWTLRHATRRNRQFLWFCGIVTLALHPIIVLFAWLSAPRQAMIPWVSGPRPAMMWSNGFLRDPNVDEHYIQWLIAAFAISLFWLLILGAIYSDQNVQGTKRKV